MSRFLYWTIVIGDQPTAFRAREAADLQPTLTQLRRKHPEAMLRWFQRGRLWTSPDEARAARERDREVSKRRPDTWRPGGRHEDPRQKYKDAKKAKWTRFKDAIRARAEARRPSSERDDSRGRPPDGKGWRRPEDGRPRPADRPREGEPHGRSAEQQRDAPRPPSPRPPSPRPFSDRKPWSHRPEPRSGGDRPMSSRRTGPRPSGSRPASPRSGSSQGKPFGSNPRGPVSPRGPRGPRSGGPRGKNRK